MTERDSRILKVREGRVLTQSLPERGYRALEQLMAEHEHRVLGQRHIIRFPAIAAFEREYCIFLTSASVCECHILKQGLADRAPVAVAECKCHVWCTLHCFQLLFANGELDVFVDDQQSSWLVGVVANPLLTEFTQCCILSTWNKGLPTVKVVN